MPKQTALLEGTRPLRYFASDRAGSLPSLPVCWSTCGILHRMHGLANWSSTAPHLANSQRSSAWGEQPRTTMFDRNRLSGICVPSGTLPLRQSIDASESTRTGYPSEKLARISLCSADEVRL